MNARAEEIKREIDKKIFVMRLKRRPIDSGDDLINLIPSVKGLYMNAGHGSRGLSYAPISSEIIAAYITGEIPPVEPDLVWAIDPRRYPVRDFRRLSLKDI